MNSVKHFNNQIYSVIYNDCKKSKRSFEDETFPPSEESLFMKQSLENYKYAKFKDKDDKELPLVKHLKIGIWERPEKICKNLKLQNADRDIKPKFVINGFNRDDVQQGILGDCWFLAAIAALTRTDKLKEKLKQVVPTDYNKILSFQCNSFTSESQGLFIFRFWRFGNWVEVVVDDKLLVYEDDSSLIFGKSGSKPNEFWFPLLEKAYAKFNGSYEALQGGFELDALVDLTGALGQELGFKYYHINIFDKKIFKIILEYMKQGLIILTCSIKRPLNEEKIEGKLEGVTDQGLITHHAHSITGYSNGELIQGGKEVHLVRIRNPWGKNQDMENQENGIWRGSWSDDSDDWNKATNKNPNKKSQNVKNDKVGGEYWMSIEDFMDKWDTLNLCHFNPNTFVYKGNKMFKKVCHIQETSRWQENSGSYVWNNKNTKYKNKKFFSIIESSHRNMPIIIDLIQDKYAKKTSNWEKLKQIVVYQAGTENRDHRAKYWTCINGYMRELSTQIVLTKMNTNQTNIEYIIFVQKAHDTADDEKFYLRILGLTYHLTIKALVDDQIDELCFDIHPDDFVLTAGEPVSKRRESELAKKQREEYDEPDD